MIVINVQNNAYKRGQMQKVSTVFAGFDHNVIAVASFAVTADQWQLAADYGGGVFARQLQHGRVVTMVVVLPWVPETQTLWEYMRLT